MSIAAIASPTSAASVTQLTDLAGVNPATGPAHHRPLSGAALRNAAPAEQRKAVAQQFEAILVRQMLSKTMSSMLGSDKAGPSANVYGDMLTDTFAQQLTAGPGLGLSRLLEQQLSPRGVTVTSAAQLASTEAKS